MATAAARIPGGSDRIRFVSGFSSIGILNSASSRRKSGGFFANRAAGEGPRAGLGREWPETGGFSGSYAPRLRAENAHRLAGHRKVALLNDALLRWPFPDYFKVPGA